MISNQPEPEAGGNQATGKDGHKAQGLITEVGLTNQNWIDELSLKENRRKTIVTDAITFLVMGMVVS